MRRLPLLMLTALLAFSGVGADLHAEDTNEPRSLYVYSFGGIEAMEVA